MAHSTWVALAVISLYVVYITARGELGQYLSLIIGPLSPSTTSSTGAGSSAGGVASTIGQAANTAQNLGRFIKQLLPGGGVGPVPLSDPTYQGAGGSGNFGGGGDSPTVTTDPNTGGNVYTAPIPPSSQSSFDTGTGDFGGGGDAFAPL